MHVSPRSGSTSWMVQSPYVDCHAETIGPVASYPTVDMSKLNNGEGADSTSNSLKDQMLPDNGVLWNLDRIDQRKLPLNREYMYGLAALQSLESDTYVSVCMQCRLGKECSRSWCTDK